MIEVFDGFWEGSAPGRANKFIDFYETFGKYDKCFVIAYFEEFTDDGAGTLEIIRS